MSNITKALLFLLLISVSPLLAQIPQGISYQAVACDANGVELVGQTIRVKASILKDGPNGSLLWVETHAVDQNSQNLKTDNFGLFTINIGQGTPQAGGSVALFDNIDWGYGNLWLKIELDPTGSSPFAFVAANRMWSVPYALYTKRAGTAEVAVTAQTAATAMDDLDKNPTNELRDLKWDPITKTLSVVPFGTGSTVISGFGGNLAWDPITKTLSLVDPITGANQSSVVISGGSSNQTITYDPVTNSISLAPNGGTINLGAIDNDKDPQNELRELKLDALGNLSLVPVGQGTPTVAVGKELKYDPVLGTISLVPVGQGTNTPIVFDPSSTNELQALFVDPITKELKIVPQGTPGAASSIVFPDNSPTNELQDLSYNPTTGTITLVPLAPGTNPAPLTFDPSSTNEIQTLQWNAASNSLSIISPNGNTTSISIPAGAGGDPSSTNELQTLTYDGNTLTLSPSASGVLNSVSFNDNDKDPFNEIQALNFDPATNKISLSAPAGSALPPSTITLDDADKNPLNEIQTLNFDPTTNKITLSAPAGSTAPANSITLDDADKNPFNEIQTLNFDPATNKITLSAPAGSTAPATSITLDDNDKSPTNELQSLSFNPVTKELALFPPVAGQPSVTISDADSNPTNELQSLTYDSLTRTIAIHPAPSTGSGSIRLNVAPPGNNEFPLNCGPTEYLVLFGPSYTVQPGKTLFITAASQDVKLQTLFGLVTHANSPSMPMLPSGTTVSNCFCTAYSTKTCIDWTPVVIDFNDPNFANGFLVPAGKVFVVKSGIPIDFGRLEVSSDGGSSWTTLVVALSPYEAASRAPTFPGGLRVRPPFNTKFVITGYLFNN